MTWRTTTSTAVLILGLAFSRAVAAPAAEAEPTLAEHLVLQLLGALESGDPVVTDRALAGLESALTARGAAAIEVDAAAERFLLDRVLTEPILADPTSATRAAAIAAELRTRLGLEGSPLVPTRVGEDSPLVLLDLGDYPFRRFYADVAPGERLLFGAPAERCEVGLSALLWDETGTRLTDYRRTTRGHTLLRAEAAGRVELRVRPILPCTGKPIAWLRRLPAARAVSIDHPLISLDAPGHEILEVPVLADAISKVRFQGAPLVRHRIWVEQASADLDAALALWQGEAEERISENDDRGDSLDPRLDVWTLTDQPYLLQVGAVNRVAGQLDLHIETSPIPPLSLGTPVELDFGEDNPQLVHIAVEAGRTYRVETRDLESAVDTVLVAFRPGERSALDWNDDSSPEHLASRLVLNPEESGTLILAVYDISRVSAARGGKHRRGTARLVVEAGAGESVEPARFVHTPSGAAALETAPVRLASGLIRNQSPHGALKP